MKQQILIALRIEESIQKHVIQCTGKATDFEINAVKFFFFLNAEHIVISMGILGYRQ